MTGRRHAQPDQQQQQQQYDRAQISSNGLACPFAKSDPDAYMAIGACRATEGFKTLRELNEHIWRKHTPFFRCGFCPSRWSISTARGKVAQQKEEHWEICEGKRHGLQYFERFDEDGTELLDGEQQERFAKVKSIRGNDRKLEALYEACDKPVPDTYYTPVALPAVQPQVTYRAVTRTTTTTRRVQQPDSHAGEFLAGFVQPRPEGHPRQPRRRTTADNVSRANAQAAGGGGYEVSGANRPPDNDSGYGSMPRNDADANDVSPADGFPPSHQPGGTTYYWGQGSHVSSYETSGGHVAAAATSGHDGGNPAPLNDHLYRGCFGLDVIDPTLYGGASSSNGRDGGSQVLLGLALTDQGGVSAEDPVNLWTFANLDDELTEYSGNQPLD